MPSSFNLSDFFALTCGLVVFGVLSDLYPRSNAAAAAAAQGREGLHRRGTLGQLLALSVAAKG